MGHTISNLTIRNSSASWSAIFENIQSSTIQNIIFKNIDVSNIHASLIAYCAIMGNNFSKVGITGNINTQGGDSAAFICSSSLQGYTLSLNKCYSRVNYSGSQQANSGLVRGYDLYEKFVDCYVSNKGQQSPAYSAFVNDLDGNTIIKGCFFNKDLIQASKPGYNTGTGLTTAEMGNLTNFTNAGWDFTNDWYMATDSEGNTYPELKFN